jgi:putative phosphoesterase
MKQIGLISDTHGYLDETVFKHFEQCDEIWHAGDFGSITLAEQLQNGQKDRNTVVRGVYGNIDGYDVRSVYPEQLVWTCEEVKVLMMHIGGYPPKYNTKSKTQLRVHRPGLFICGHSHILKIMYDENLQCLHMNPGAAGKQGWHSIRTIVRFAIDGKEMKNCEVIELGKR